MAYTCYHCEHDVEKVRYVTFYNVNEEYNEPLCETCYAEWLESIKG